MTAALNVPTSWEGIGADWMTDALDRDFPGVRVTEVTVAMRDDGTNRRARLQLRYAPGPAGPATVFVKAVDPDHRELIKLTSGLLHEPRLFNADVDLPLEHPRVYAAAIDEAAEDFVLVMEDLTARGADQRDGTRPLTIEQAAAAVRGLGRLHGRYWGARIAASPGLDWLEPFLPWDGMQYAPLPAALERLGADAPASVHALTIDELVEGIWKPFIRTLTAPGTAQTLLHGDPHIGNTYLTPSGDIGFLDWQVARRGNFSVDLGYFLQGALVTEDRRMSERDLLAEYRDSLGLPADEMPTVEEVWLRYRASVAHGLTTWLATASAGELWQRPDIALALAQRYSSAYEDLQTAEALRDLST